MKKMSDAEKFAISILGNPIKGPKKIEQSTTEKVTKFKDTVDNSLKKYLMEQEATRIATYVKPEVATGDPIKTVGASAGMRCNKSIKSTRALGEETLDEQKGTEDKKSVMKMMFKQKNLELLQEEGQEQE